MRPFDLQKMKKFISSEANELILIHQVMEDLEKLSQIGTVKNLLRSKLVTKAEKLKPVKEFVYTSFPEAKNILEKIYSQKY